MLEIGEIKMAKLIVNIPDGELCMDCQFNTHGTVECTFFEKLLEENENDGICKKCKECPRK